MPNPSKKISPEQYRELRAQVEANKVAIYDGRTAHSIDELEQIIKWSADTAWNEEESAKRLAEASSNPFASAEVKTLIAELSQLRDDFADLQAKNNDLQAQIADLADLKQIIADLAAKQSRADLAAALGPAPGPQGAQ